MRFSFLLVLALLPGASLAEDVPLPRPRPVQPSAAPSFEVDPLVVQEPREASACQMRVVADGIAIIEVIPSIGHPDGCGAIDVVKLKEIVLPDRSRAVVMPPPTLRCEMAEAVAHWVREDVTPELGKLGATLRALDNFDSYECRGRNRIIGARLSEHGRANALDVRGMRLADGRFLELTDRAAPRAYREAIRASVCTRFNTVLGPGSDGYHENHIHLDLAARRNNYKICQWNVLDPAPEVPLPRPRPAEAPAAE